MPKVVFLVPASPTGGFYSQIAAMSLALQRLSWKRWEPCISVTMGARTLTTIANDTFERWLDYVAEVDFTYVARSRSDRMGNWAQVDSSMLAAPRDGDVYITIDADVLPTGDLEAVLDTVEEERCIAGVMAHHPPPPLQLADDWHELASAAGMRPPDCRFEYSLETRQSDRSRLKAPPYFNGGVIFFSRRCFQCFVMPYLAMRPTFASLLGEWSDYSGQVAATFAASELELPVKVLPMRFNFPNDDAALETTPGELDHVVLFHYLRTHEFDRRKIFASRAAYDSFLRQPLEGTGLAFQSAVARVLGTAYPFP